VRFLCKPWLVAVCLLAGCGSTSPSLSRAERDRLPLDGRQEIFDAENDLIIALNRADLARDQVRSLKKAQDDLDDVQKSCERRLSSNAGQADRIPQLRKAIRAERDYFDARTDVAEAEVAVAQQEIRIARSRLDLVKQRQLVRTGKAPSASLKTYERVIDEQEAKGKQVRSTSLDLRTKAQSLLDLWKNAQAEYARQSGDFDSGIWLQ
jgi:chromosome segregation ATPase